MNGARVSGRQIHALQLVLIRRDPMALQKTEKLVSERDLSEGGIGGGRVGLWRGFRGIRRGESGKYRAERGGYEPFADREGSLTTRRRVQS
jgi:hypothetical protein